MRLYFQTSRNTELVHYDYQQKMVGALHKWLGENIEHDGISLYSISWLSGARPAKKGLNFPEGANFFISAHEGDLLERIITGVRDDPTMFNGMRAQEIIIGSRPEFSEREYLHLASPALVRRKTDKGCEHLEWNNPAADERMTEVMQSKMKLAGLSGDIRIRFDRDYQRAKTKIVNFNNIQNKANLCPVILEGAPELIRFAYNVGVGESAGAGFGAVRL